MSTGFDHIDIEECKRRKIKVSNVPFYGENTVAEHAFGLILTLSRKIHQAIERTKRDDFSVDGLMGFDLKGKTLGVIGPGHIGQNVIRMAKGFEMNVIAFSPFKDMKIARKLGFKYVSLNRLLKSSDIITIHAPLVPGTKHLINMKNVKMIKKGAYLVNTARGGIVETEALKYALDRKILAGAALDVLEGEQDIKEEKELIHKKMTEQEWQTLIRNHLIVKDKNVVVTPHSAFYSKEAVERIVDTTLENIKGFLKGKNVNSVFK
jgi:D-lactate dehydrogenase